MALRCRKWYGAPAESIQQVPTAARGSRGSGTCCPISAGAAGAQKTPGNAGVSPAAAIQQVQQVFLLASTAHLLLKAAPWGSSSSSVGYPAAGNPEAAL